MNLIINVEAVNIYGLVTDIMKKIDHENMMNLKYFINKPNPKGGYVLEFQDYDNGKDLVAVEYDNLEDFVQNFSDAYKDMTGYDEGFELVTEVIGLLATSVKEADKIEVTHGVKDTTESR